MVHWSNWSGKRTAEPDAIHYIRSEEDAAALAKQATEANQTIRVAGGGHSHSLLVPNDMIIADMSGLAGVVSVDSDSNRALVRAGTPIYALGAALHTHGLALKNQGDVDRQTIAGACATGTHGMGRRIANLSSSVTGARIALANGELVDCSPSQNPEVWQVARLNLGAIGFVTRLELQLRDSYRLKESAFVVDTAELLERLPALIDDNDRFEFYWSPQRDKAFAKRMNETDEPAQYPLGREGSRLAWSFEVYPSHRTQLHTEMEYSVPLESGPACFAEIRSMIMTRFPEVEMPVEYRAIAPDDVWLSTANSRESVSISLHRDSQHDETEYFQAGEEIFLRHGGRPHWGKVNYLDGTQLASRHANWASWWKVRDEVDPNGTFLNEYLRSVQPT